MPIGGRLISVEVDGNYFAVELEVDGHGRHRVEQPVTSELSVRLQRFVIHEIFPGLMFTGDEIVVDLIESNVPGETYEAE